ncbi:MAG: hypothetical protein L3J07_04780 [Candidatus Magasanikbacteria bacterium]|nr:hypothetical protein [Candidatus Magasanikbacteria bacterium]
MVLTLVEQINQVLENKKNVLVCFPKNGNHDAIASSIALSLFFKKLGKNVDVISESFKNPEQLNFLPETKKITSKFEDLRRCIIKVDLTKNGLKEVNYSVAGDKLSISITPKNGAFLPDQIKMRSTEFKYDLIVTVGVVELESLGKIYRNNTKLFFDTPILNVGFSTENEHFGHINFVNITSTSISETVYLLINKLASEHLDSDIANALLTGMIVNTKSFQSPKIRPRTLMIASQLIKLGANRQEVVQNLYKNKKLSTLKLWGDVLTNLQNNIESKFVWSTITSDNFVRTGTNVKDLNDIFDDLILTSPDAKIVLLLHEHPKQNNSIYGILKTVKPFNAIKISREFRPTGNSTEVRFVLTNETLKNAENKITQKILENL